MTQQNQQNPGQQVLLVLLRVSQANLSKIQPGKAREIKPPDTAALKYWLGCRQPDREPLEIHVKVSKPVSDEGQEGCGKFESLDTAILMNH